jgi:hypothetical protein
VVISTPKRCEDVKCGCLAADGTCLMPKEDLKEKCPARETVINEHKDNWFDELYKLKLRD